MKWKYTSVVAALIVVAALLVGSRAARAGDSTPVSDKGVVPWRYPEADNISCEDLGYGNKLKIEADAADERDRLQEGTFEFDGNSVTISNLANNKFDWEASLTIDAVIVKDGVDGSNVYEYDPAETSDGGLGTPFDAAKAISHVSFCFDYRLTAEKTAKTEYTRTYDWDITKSTEPASHSGWFGDEFTSAYAVTVTQSITDSHYKVTGVITISNPTPYAVTFGVEDYVNETQATVTCAEGYELAAGESTTCAYTAELGDELPPDGINTATIISNHDSVKGTKAEAQYTFGDPTTVVGEETVNVKDDHDNDAYDQTWGPVSSSTTWVYSATFQCSTDPGEYQDGVYTLTENNTATIQETGDSDSETVTVACYAPVVDKDAQGIYDERHEWDLLKTVVPGSQSAFAGDPVGWTWTIVVTDTVFEESFLVTGVISVSNPIGAPESITVSLDDDLDDGTSATVDCGDGATEATVAPGATETCTYTAAPDDASATSNTATALFNGTPFTATAPVSFTKNVINGSATVSDTETPLEDKELSGSAEFTYTDSALCSSQQADYDSDGKYDVTISNTATLVDEVNNQYQSTASTTYTCYAPVVEKDADTEWYEDYAWGITKTAHPASHSGYAGDVFTSTYTVSVDQTVTQGGYRAFGTIWVTNPHPTAAMTVEVADAVEGVSATVDCGNGTTELMVGPDATETCVYSLDLADGSQRINTATVTFNEIDFTATAAVVFGDPLITGYPEITVTDTQPESSAPWAASASSGWTYTANFVCPLNQDLYTDGVYSETVPNTATISQTSQSDDAVVDLTCTLTEEDPGNIIVQKETEPAGADQPFEFSPSWGDSFFLADGEQHESGDLEPGTYSVEEISIPEDWELDSVVCTSSYEDNQSPGEISLQAGETVTCVFTNVFVAHPSYAFDKFINGEDADTVQDAVAVEEGDELTFTYVVTNTGNVAITWTGLQDDVFGDLTAPCELPREIAVGQSAACDYVSEAGEHPLGKENVGTVSVQGLDDQADPAWYITPEPTPVTLLYFRAQGMESAIQVEWGTAAEIAMAGYYVYRGQSEGFEGTSPIAFRTSRGSDSTYEVLDQDVTADKTYWYWLVSVGTDGSTERKGPVKASIIPY